MLILAFFGDFWYKHRLSKTLRGPNCIPTIAKSRNCKIQDNFLNSHHVPYALKLSWDETVADIISVFYFRGSPFNPSFIWPFTDLNFVSLRMKVFREKSEGAAVLLHDSLFF